MTVPVQHVFTGYASTRQEFAKCGVQSTVLELSKHYITNNINLSLVSFFHFRQSLGVENLYYEVAEISKQAEIVTIGIGSFANQTYIDRLQPNPVLQMKAGFRNFTVDTAKDAATLICAAVPFVSDTTLVAGNENELEEIGEQAQNMAATHCRETSETVYPFNVTTIQDSLTFILGNRFRFTALLIVNVASFSGEGKIVFHSCHSSYFFRRDGWLCCIWICAFHFNSYFQRSKF